VSTLEDEFINLLETSASRWSTLILEGRTWSNLAVEQLAWITQIERQRAEGAQIVMLQRADSTTSASSSDVAAEVRPRDLERTWSLRITPERRRATFDVGGELVDVVIEGSTFWSNGRGRSFTNEGNVHHSHGQGDGENLIRTRDYARLLRVVNVSAGETLGRHTVDATVRVLDDEGPDRGMGLHGLTIGDVETLALSVDRERGVILRATSWFDDAVYRIVEATSIAFDIPLGADELDIQPLFGDRWATR
jgi:hypothetical protein